MESWLRLAAALIVVLTPAVVGAQGAGPPPLLEGFSPDDFRLPALTRAARVADLGTATEPSLLLGRQTPAGTIDGPPTLSDLGGGITAAEALRAGGDASPVLPTVGTVVLRVDLGLLDDLARLPSLEEALGLGDVLDLAEELGLDPVSAGVDEVVDLVDETLPIEITLPGLLQP